MRPIVLSSLAALSVLAVGVSTAPRAAAEPASASSAAPAANPAPAAKPAPAAAATAPAKPAKICTSRQVTGSLMPVHECHTADEWAEIKRHGYDSFSLDAQRHSATTGGN